MAAGYRDTHLWWLIGGHRTHTLMGAHDGHRAHTLMGVSIACSVLAHSGGKPLLAKCMTYFP